MAEDTYGFKTTSMTMVEKLSRGEDWERFCNLYHDPIKMFLQKKNGYLHCISEPDLDDAVAAVFEKLNRVLQGKGARGNPIKGYEAQEGKKFRQWLYKLIENAIKDWGEKDRKKKSELTLDVADEDGETMAVPDEHAARPDKGSEDWILFLQKCAIHYAYVRHTWKEIQKKIIKVYVIDQQGSDAESVAREFGTTPENVRKIKERFCKVAREYYAQYKDDDRDFFKEYLKIKPELAELNL